MSSLLDNVRRLVGWETEEEEEMEEFENEKKENPRNYVENSFYRKNQNKVVNIHSSNQLKVVVTRPESLDDAQEICDHLRSKKPIVINLEDVEKESAQRIVDFLCGAVYSLDGNIQKVATGILVVTPNNVDIMGNFKDELRTRGFLQWMK